MPDAAPSPEFKIPAPMSIEEVEAVSDLAAKAQAQARRALRFCACLELERFARETPELASVQFGDGFGDRGDLDVRVEVLWTPEPPDGSIDLYDTHSAELGFEIEAILEGFEDYVVDGVSSLRGREIPAAEFVATVSRALVGERGYAEWMARREARAIESGLPDADASPAGAAAKGPRL